jgi:integrase
MEYQMNRKKNGDGHTYPFRNGFRTVIKVRGISFSATGKTAAEAKRKAKEKVKRNERLNWGASTRHASATLNEFMTWWLETEHRHEVASTTFVRYQQLANFHILPFLGETKLVKLTRHDVNGLIDYMTSNGQSLRSAQQARALLSACLNAAIEEDLIGANPVGASRKIRLPRFEIEPLTAAEAARVVQIAPSPSAKLRLELALYYGLRQGEALGLQWKKISFEKGEMTISHQIQSAGGQRKLVGLKTKSSYRTLPLDDHTMELFRAHKAEVAKLRLAAGSKWVDSQLVFPGSEGKPLASRWDYEQWHRALDAAGVTKRRLHDARHTCATLLLEQGLDIEVIRYWLGHASIELTSNTYIHLTSKTARLGSEAIKELRKAPERRAA